MRSVLRTLFVDLPIGALILSTTSSPVHTQGTAHAASDHVGEWTWSIGLGAEYRVVPDIVYYTASNWSNRLDLYLPVRASTPVPTVIYFHGGGWMHWTRERGHLHLLPYLAMGFAVVNVDYRTGSIAPAPAAVEDSRCALRWVVRHAREYNLDTTRIVVTGHSAGGHLALMAAVLPTSAGFDRPCADDEAPDVAAMGKWHAQADVHVAATVNWYGMPDVADLAEGPNAKSYAVAWLGSRADRRELATRLSPLTYVRGGLPSVISVHGDADQISPYANAVRLHAALARVGVRNELVTVPGGGHGAFSREQTVDAYTRIRLFLERSGVLP
ncbi:MAG: hypothetical protein NVS1B4_22560 [Gemmatimonadaceae bacterium]